ncbi:hypothetical protein UZ38_32415 [Bacillus amyloliquefaciens]|nr:hypothetical protein UZ38_32415 [Bacillus amyloliquefaciens]
MGQEKGWLVRKKPETIVSVIRAIVLLSFQKSNIGEDRYDETMDLLIELIGQGLSAKEDASHD